MNTKEGNATLGPDRAERRIRRALKDYELTNPWRCPAKLKAWHPRTGGFRLLSDCRSIAPWCGSSPLQRSQACGDGSRLCRTRGGQSSEAEILTMWWGRMTQKISQEIGEGLRPTILSVLPSHMQERNTSIEIPFRLE